MPLVTIVITGRDRPELLRRALDSALAQSVEDVEVIVVDDGSSPALELGRSDARVRLIRLDRSLGACAARNAGLAEAAGAYVTFLDDDDELTDRMVERSLEALRASRLASPIAALSGLERVDAEGTVVSTVSPTSCPRGSFDFLLDRPSTAIIGNSLLAPTAVMRQIGGWDPAVPMHDELFFRLLPACSIQATPSIGYRMTASARVRMTQDKLAMGRWLSLTERKHRRSFAGYRRQHALYLNQVGVHFLWGDEWRAAIAATTRALLIDPRTRHGLRNWARALGGPPALRAYRRARRVLQRRRSMSPAVS